jgi:hypothetical protein
MRRAQFIELLSRAAGLTALLLAVPPANAQAPASPACTAADLAVVVDDMSAKLRATSMETYPRLQERMRQLAAKKGWLEIEAEAKAEALLDDDESRALDERAGQLLIELDRKGPSEVAAPTCEQVAALKVTANQLIEVTRSKSAHSIAKLDIELGAKPPVKAAEAKPELKLVPVPEAKAPETRPARPPVLPPVTAQSPPPVPRPKAPLPWDTQTVQAPEPPPPVAALPPTAPLEALQFSEEDIRAAGRGIFGTISAELAGVIEYAFNSYGRPTGYILGTEGGAALLAGLRYGEGVLVTKREGERRIFWQGPSVGYDFGLAGSRTMVLVYNLQDPEAMMARFAGVDGSAYLVGGVGLTILKKGPIILAPIRTGLGLRVGANIGYLKFTPKASFNPF